MATMAKSLRDKFKQLELEYKAKIKVVHDENSRAMAALQERQDKEGLTFSQKQEQQKSEFSKKQILEKLAFDTNQTKEKSAFDNEKRAERDRLKEQSTNKLKNTEKFIEEIRFPSNSTLQRRFWGFEKGPKQENCVKNAEAWKELECPVCLNEMKPPTRIWQCSQGHPLCAPCRKNPSITQCPTCRMGFVGRNTALEKIALALFEETNSSLSSQPTNSSVSTLQASQASTFSFNSPLASQLLINSSNSSQQATNFSYSSSQATQSTISSCCTPETDTASIQQDITLADSECLKFSSSGPSATVQTSKMGVYRKNREAFNGFPVYEMLGADWFLLVNNNMDWVVSRELGPYPTSFLVNRRKPTPQCPPSTGWQYVTETGVWREDTDLKLTPLD